MERLDRARVIGRVGVDVAGFRAWLAARGYAERTIAEKLRLVARLSEWMETERVEVGAVMPAVMERFAATAACRGSSGVRRSTLPQLLAYLRETGVAPPPPPVAPSPAMCLADDYGRYLVERVLSPLTVENYLRTARMFLAYRGTVTSGGVTSTEVSAFMLWAGRGRKPRTVNEIVGHMRSFLRFLYLRSELAAPLDGTLLRMPRWRARGLPRGLPDGVAARVLAGCDRTTVAGARDFAMLTLVARLGLRAGEVAAMQLGDLDWRRGELEVRGKGGRRDTLPVPVDVGEALSAYLQLRGPRAGCRQVFLHVRAARSPGVSQTNVRAAMRRACARAGVADTGTHRFRHALATAMLAGGASLPEIGHLLRHQDVGTTSIYAKVDAASLSTVAKAWPGSRA